MRLPAPATTLRRHLGLLCAVAVVVAGAAVFAVRALAGPEVAVQRIVRRDFVQSVVASGHLEAPHRATIGAVLAGRVVHVPVVQGQAVAAGAVLVQLDDAELAASAAQADAAVAQAASRLRQVREVDAPVAEQAWRQAGANLDNARALRERDAALRRQGFIGPAAMEEADKALAIAQAQWQAALSQHRAALPAGSAVAIAVDGLAQARAAAAAAHSRLGQATLRAPAAGSVLARSVEPGDVVQPGAALMTLSPDGPAQVVVDFDEKNLHLLAPGQPARVSADAYPDRPVDARLATIDPGIDLQRGTVQVKLDVDHPPAWLRQDMTMSVDVQVGARAHALVVPLDAVQDAAGGRAWVARVEGGRVHRRPVRLGLRGPGFAEVLDGLEEGDLVAAAPSTLADGERVRALAARP
jgi:HlyD family secretion protein